MTMEVYEVVSKVAVELLRGRVLSARDVTAGNGKVIDWREVRSGDVLLDGGDAYDVAYLFVSLVGDPWANGAAPADELAYGVFWTSPPDPEIGKHRERSGWILRNGRDRWLGTLEEAKAKVRRYAASSCDDTDYRATPTIVEGDEEVIP